MNCIQSVANQVQHIQNVSENSFEREEALAKSATFSKTKNVVSFVGLHPGNPKQLELYLVDHAGPVSTPVGNKVDMGSPRCRPKHLSGPVP